MKPLMTGLVFLMIMQTNAGAQSCYDLWYARNLIYAQNGYCFTTDLGQRVFGSYPCWTSNPPLSGNERSQVKAIAAQERSRGCKVNN